MSTKSKRLNFELNESSPLNHEINSGLLAILSEGTESISLSIDSHDQASKAGKYGEFIVFFDDVKNNTISDIVKVVLLWRFVRIFRYIKIGDIIAVGDSDEEWFFQGDGVYLSVDINLHVEFILGDHVDTGYVSEWGFVVRIYFLYFESVFENLSVLHSEG